MIYPAASVSLLTYNWPAVVIKESRLSDDPVMHSSIVGKHNKTKQNNASIGFFDVRLSSASQTIKSCRIKTSYTPRKEQEETFRPSRDKKKKEKKRRSRVGGVGGDNDLKQVSLVRMPRAISP